MPTVGEILSAERRRQGKTLTDVVEGTKIRSRLLDSLEQGRYEELPSPAYVKGYIQSYARYLEIPVDPLLEQYKKESAGTPASTSPADRYLAEIPREPLVANRGRQHEIPRGVWIIGAVVVVVLVLLSCILTQCTGGGSPANTNPATVGGSTTTQSPGATSTATTSTTTTSAGFKVRVTVRQGLASYVKVTVDGLDGFTGTLQGGESREFLVTNTVTIVVGKPDAVVVTRDGKQVTLPSSANARVTLSAATH